jgi:hypothetical protein
MSYIIETPERIEELAEELGVEHEDFERLAEFISLMWVQDDSEQALRDNLAKWAESEQECYYGQHATPAEFAKYYFDNYDTHSELGHYLVIDWEATWDNNLRHDFYFNDNGYVWAEVY